MPLADEFKNLNAFIHAARHGSFTAAAHILGITPAAVSKNIGILEKTLGVRLFQRTTRSLSLTDEGRNFFTHAETAVNLLQHAADNIHPARQSPAGIVRLSVSSAIGRSLILPQLPGLLHSHPAICLEIDLEDRVIDFVQAGYDLVVRGGNIAESAMISRNIAPLRVCLAASPAYLAQHGTPRRSEDLDTHRIIMRHLLGGKLMPWHFRGADGALHPYTAARRALTLSDPEAITRAALDGIGIAEIPLYLAWPHLQAGRLKTLLADSHHEGSYRLVLQYAHRNLAPRVRAVAEYLLEKLGKEPALHAGKDELNAFAA